MARSNPVGSERLTILQGDALNRLRELPSESVQCCVTSPPYWGLRDYQVEGQIGLEKTPAEYVAKLVAILAEVRRVLRMDGTLWLNLGDSYSNGTNDKKSFRSDKAQVNVVGRRPVDGLKPKNLIGIPWTVAFALRDDGWYLRSEITWCKKAPMPESVTDRPSSATEKIFLFSKSARYFYDADAVRQPPSESFLNDSRWKTGSTPDNCKGGYEESGAQNPKKLHRMFDKQRGHKRTHVGLNGDWDNRTRHDQQIYGANMRNYWLLGPEPYAEAHFATFPTEIPRRAILAGCLVGGTVLDCFAGSGTTGKVALELGRNAVLIELNPEYIKLIKQRCDVTPGLHL